jgi:hypothetical protein
MLIAACAVPLGPDYSTLLERLVVTDYNLQRYVPVPVEGEPPVKALPNRVDIAIEVAWKDAAGNAIPNDGFDVFVSGTVYQADISITTKVGYAFDDEIPFAYEPEAVESQTSGDNTHESNRIIQVVYKPTYAPEEVNLKNLTPYIPKPVTGGIPIPSFAGPQYTGTIHWEAVSPSGSLLNGAFKPLTAYKAAVTLVAASGYTFAGLDADVFAHDHAEYTANAANSGMVEISFIPTDPLYVENYNLQDYVPVPAAGNAPVKSITGRSDMKVTVTWRNSDNDDINSTLTVFQLGTVYKADITLEPKEDYAFRDQPFEYPLNSTGAPTVSHQTPNDGPTTRIVSVNYKPTANPDPVSALDLAALLPAPVSGGIPCTSFPGDQYNGTVSWSSSGVPLTGLFQPGTAYTAVADLNAVAGYTFTGVQENGFTHGEAGTAVSNPLGSGAAMTVTVLFPATAFNVIDNYDLQDYVPIPITGQMPVKSITSRADLTVTVEWQDADGIALASLSTFQPGTVYKAKIIFAAKSGYAFGEEARFAYQSPESVSSQEDGGGESPRTVLVTYLETECLLIENYDLQSYVPVPVKGQAPVTSITNRQDMTVEVEWKDADGDTISDLTTFQLDTVYQALITLTAKKGYAFKSQSFKYPDGEVSTQPEDNTDPSPRTLTVTYERTQAPAVITEMNLSVYIPAPVTGATGPSYFAGSQYSGSVSWTTTDGSAHSGPFKPNTVYTAELALIPAAGYTLEGVSGFTHDDTSEVSYDSEAKKVTIVFEKTARRFRR